VFFTPEDIGVCVARADPVRRFLRSSGRPGAVYLDLPAKVVVPQAESEGREMGQGARWIQGSLIRRRRPESPAPDAVNA